MREFVEERVKWFLDPKVQWLSAWSHRILNPDPYSISISLAVQELFIVAQEILEEDNG